MFRHLSFKSLAILVALTFAAMYFVAAIPRVLYPYDLDFLEDSMLMHALRFAQDRPVYFKPGAEFTAHIYMPLYAWLGGLLFRLVGPGFVPLRLLSLAATLATAGLLFYIARRESGRLWLGLVCAGLYLGGYRLSGFWYELARVDSLYVALAMLGAALGIYGCRSRPDRSQQTRQVLTAAVLALAFFTKQTGLAFAAGVAAYLFLTLGKQGAIFLGAFIAMTVAPLIVFHAQTGGWFSFYVFGGAAGDPVETGRVFNYLGFELFGTMAGLSVMAVAAAVLAARRAGRGAIREQPWLMMMATAAVVSGVGRSSVGGNLNNLMIGYAFLCLAPALLWKEMNREDARPALFAPPALFRGSRLIPAFIILQFALGAYNPLRYIPTPEMRQSGDRLVARIAAIDGEVLVMMHPYYALLAGKEPAAQAVLIWHAHVRQAQPLPQDFVARIESQYYAAIISDETLFETDPEIRELVAAYYTPTGILETNESPPTLAGMFARPTVIYTPKAQPANGG